MIRTATIKDLPDIVTIYNEAIPDRQATADLEEVSMESRLSWFHLHHNNRPLWVYESEREVSGWLSFQDFYGRPAYNATVEFSVYIKHKFKRQGIAKKLLSYAIHTAPQLDIATILGFIFGHNTSSIRLVRGLGFEQWGYLPKIATLDSIEKDLAIYGLRIKKTF